MHRLPKLITMEGFRVQRIRHSFECSFARLLMPGFVWFNMSIFIVPFVELTIPSKLFRFLFVNAEFSETKLDDQYIFVI